MFPHPISILEISRLTSSQGQSGTSEQEKKQEIGFWSQHNENKATKQQQQQI